MIGSLLVVALSAAAGLSANDRPPARQTPEVSAPERRGGPRAGGALSPGEVVAMLDAYAVVQAQEALQLSDSQYAPFVTRLKKLQETRRRNQQTHNQIVQELRRLAGPQAAPPFDEAAIRDRLRALRDLDDRSALELRKAYDAVDEVLDVRQQARFRMFEDMIERRKLDLLMRARQRAAGRRGGG
jgi:Spy/CpxP family protein refolding chaperone